MPKTERPLPPPPAPEQTQCVYGGTDPARGWLWLPALGQWERVCAAHWRPRQLTAGLYVPDVLTIPRQEP
ncbi:hypothetical protein MF672_010745 [Actinomadura sp. ATCC 31491]|uniref:MbtH family NRPS accessory protein n=1 Tax=Actinomadura luzonensis TaxID=2805427 RepID=A0ABT0FPL2_9ACTN|nr:hypothetical protein [Actinomadura luzonensis]MCK2214264.1 hypothetical protein [Actinomadura luzonensis]